MSRRSIGAVKTYAFEIATDTTNLGTNDEDLQSQLEHLESIKLELGDVADLTSDVATLQTDVSNNTSNISTIQTELDTFPDELKNLTASEIQQLQNINTEIISATEWGYLASLDQSLSSSSSPTFSNLTIDSAIPIFDINASSTFGSYIDVDADSDTGSYPICLFRASISGGSVSTRPLFRFLNGTSTDVLTIAASGDLTSSGDVSSSGGSLNTAITRLAGISTEVDSLTASEIQQLQNINSTTISGTQWGYLGSSNQGIATTDDVAFNSVDTDSITSSAVIEATPTDHFQINTTNATAITPTLQATLQCGGLYIWNNAISAGAGTGITLGSGGSKSGIYTEQISANEAKLHLFVENSASHFEDRLVCDLNGVLIPNILYVNTIEEYTANSGITIDSVLIKDGQVDGVDISALSTTVSTNASSIATNTSNITVNSGNIATNTSSIATNTSNISTLTTDVAGFPDALKNLTTAEIAQLENIGATTISATQWGYLGSADQALVTTSDVIFNSVGTATYDLDTIGATVDGLSGLTSLTAGEIAQIGNIDTTTINTTQWGYLGGLDQSLSTTDNATFNDINSTNTITITNTTNSGDVFVWEHGSGSSRGLRIHDFGGSGSCVPSITLSPQSVYSAYITCDTDTDSGVNAVCRYSARYNNSTVSTRPLFDWCNVNTVCMRIEADGTIDFQSGHVTTSGNLSATNITGTLQTASQPNITSVGTLSSLDVTGDLDVNSRQLEVDTTNNVVAINIGPNSVKTEVELDVRGRASFTGNVKADSLYVGAPDIGVLEIETDNSSTAGFTLTDNSKTYQTITQSTTTEIVAISWSLDHTTTPGDYDCILYIHSGTGTSSTPLYAETHTLSLTTSEAWVKIPLLHPVSVSSGTYTIALENQSGSSIDVYYDSANPYAGGSSFENASWDFLLRTYVYSITSGEIYADRMITVNPYVCEIEDSGGYSIGSSSTTPPLDTVVFDPHGMATTSTSANASYITVPISGYYLVHANTWHNGSGSVYLYIRHKDSGGSTLEQQLNTDGATSLSEYIGASWVFKCDAGDRIDYAIYSTSTTTFGATSHHQKNRLQVIYIGGYYN